MFRELIDVKEENILAIDNELLNLLLKDRSSGKNILWGTNNYTQHGLGFNAYDYITVEKITGLYNEIIKPRIKKSKEEQNIRIKEKAEVFTPSWMCNKQNNLVDNEWFGTNEIFNTEIENGWISKEKIIFPNNRNWEDYISNIRLEISCGEAPYLVSRYDTVSGKTISINDRIGLLDRKFRVLNENVDDYNTWIDYSKIVIKSIYGYDWQGDNVLLARENVLYTYIDNYKYKFNKKPSLDLIREIASIISWNIFQMDGINFIVPYSCKNEKIIELTLFGDAERLIECQGCKNGKYSQHNGTYVQIMNWTTKRKIKFTSLLKKGK